MYYTFSWCALSNRVRLYKKSPNLNIQIMKKKTFVRPEARLTAFECQDILANSPYCDPNDPNNPNSSGTNLFSNEPLNPGNFDWGNGQLGG